MNIATIFSKSSDNEEEDDYNTNTSQAQILLDITDKKVNSVILLAMEGHTE